jgi:hypothetical protein
MTSEFWFLVGAAVFAAWGTRVALTAKLPLWVSLPVVALYLFLGIHTVLLAGLAGDGRIVPGYQLSPEIRNVFGYETAHGRMPSPHPGWSWLAVLAHALVLARGTGKAAFWRPLPATVFFIAVFWVFQARATRPPTSYLRAVGPEQNAYLTMSARSDGIAFVLAAGDDDATLLPVLAARDMDEPPASLRLYWTKDGRGLVVASYRRRIFAVDLDGETVGVLPEHKADWPEPPSKFEPTPRKRRLSHAERDVAEFVVNHGGLHVE